MSRLPMATLPSCVVVLVLLNSKPSLASAETKSGYANRPFGINQPPEEYHQGHGVGHNHNPYDGNYVQHYVSYIHGVGSCVQHQARGFGASAMSYIQDPVDNCRVYVCRDGRFLLTQSVNCPLDPAYIRGPYDQFGQSQGRPCAQCAGIQQHQQQQLRLDTSLYEEPLTYQHQQHSQHPQIQPLQPSGLGIGGNAVLVNPVPYASSQRPPDGFVTVVAGARVNGGYRMLTGATLTQCLSTCMMTSFCLAVDYDRVARTCYVHGPTFCNDVTSLTTSNHYKRVPCSAYSAGMTGIDIRNRAVEVWTNYRLNPLATGSMRPFCSRCRLIDCLSSCYNDIRCQAINYVKSATSCYLLNVTNACGSLVPANDVLHITTIKCSSFPTNPLLSAYGQAGRPVGSSYGIAGSGPAYGVPNIRDGYPYPYGELPGTGTLYNNFVAVKYLGPTSLPANWLGYPGSRVVGGTRVGSRISGAQCVALCQVYSSCYSVDYNSIDGSCWVHTSELIKCSGLVPTNYVYHVKKPPGCAFITGTYRTYPLAVTIGSAQH